VIFLNHKISLQGNYNLNVFSAPPKVILQSYFQLRLPKTF